MLISLKDIEFDNDFFSFNLPSGAKLTLNKVQEDFIGDGERCILNVINLFVIPYDDTVQVNCSSIIGMSNDYFKLTSDYTEYLGKPLTAENMQYCMIEVADE